MTFRDRLIATIRAARPVLESPGVLVVGSEVPNLFEKGAAATMVVSQDLDVGVPVDRHAALKERLGDLREFEPSADEPSVWTPRSDGLLELNFVGMDAAQDPAEAYVFEDDRLPLLVFGALSLVSRGTEIEIGGTRLALPRPAGLLLEKLVTDRTGEKGERDLLSLLAPRSGMPDLGRGGRVAPPPRRRIGGRVTAIQERRLRELRSRVLVRAFDHRQRRHARGVWFRFRRVLAFASEAYALPRDEAERLIAEGHSPEPVGRELEPPRVILFVRAERVARIAAARRLVVRLSAEMLAAEFLALVPFETEAGAAR